jgi:hypothetical protein
MGADRREAFGGEGWQGRFANIVVRPADRDTTAYRDRLL